MKTKHFLATLLFALCLFSANQLSAQIRFGIKGGIDVADHKISTDILKVSNQLGYQIGGTMQIGVPFSGFGGDISLLYGRKEYKVENADISNYDYISIPINIKQRFSVLGLFGVFVTGGVFGDVKLDGGNFSTIINDYKSKNFAFGLSAGAGVSLLKHLDVGMYYRGELTKRFSSSAVETDTFVNKKFQSWSVGMTYFF